MGWTLDADDENRLLKFEISLSRGQKRQKLQNRDFFCLMTVFEKILIYSRIYQDSTRLAYMNSTLPRLSRKNSFNQLIEFELNEKSRKLKFFGLKNRKFDEIDHFSSWCRPDSRCLVIWYCSLDFLEQPCTKSFWPLRVIWSQIAFYEKLIFQI